MSTPAGTRPSGPSGGRSGDLLASQVTATMITGPLLFAGLGWLLDRLVGTAPLFVALGMLLGTGLALYVVWIRYGTGSSSSDAPSAPAPAVPEGED